MFGSPLYFVFCLLSHNPVSEAHHGEDTANVDPLSPPGGPPLDHRGPRQPPHIPYEGNHSRLPDHRENKGHPP